MECGFCGECRDGVTQVCKVCVGTNKDLKTSLEYRRRCTRREGDGEHGR